jgi:rubrerythrin
MNATLLRYAAMARAQSQPRLGHILQKAAEFSRRDHFAHIADSMHLGADYWDNLCLVIEQKRAAAGLYATCAQECREDGDVTAATIFGEMRADEFESANELEAIMSELAADGEAFRVAG